MSKLLTVAEAADLLAVKPATIRRWILLRQLATVKLGRCVRIRPSEIDRLVAEGERPAA